MYYFHNYSGPFGLIKSLYADNADSTDFANIGYKY